MLCKFCETLDYDKATPEKGSPHHATYADLVAPAENGCEFCVHIARYRGGDVDSIHSEGEEVDGENTNLSFHLDARFQSLRCELKSCSIAEYEVFTTDGPYIYASLCPFRQFVYFDIIMIVLSCILIETKIPCDEMRHII